MDRTAWIAIILCVIGLVAWEWWIAKQAPRPRPATSVSSPAPTPVAGTSAAAIPLASSSPVSVPTATATPAAQSTPAFAEKNETLRNDDVEIRLTNRGGAIREAVLLNHIAQGGERDVIEQNGFSNSSSAIGQANLDVVVSERLVFFGECRG